MVALDGGASCSCYTRSRACQYLELGSSDRRLRQIPLALSHGCHAADTSPFHIENGCSILAPRRATGDRQQETRTPPTCLVSPVSCPPEGGTPHGPNAGRSSQTVQRRPPHRRRRDDHQGLPRPAP